jgi:hypothetical protein
MMGNQCDGPVRDQTEEEERYGAQCMLNAKKNGRARVWITTWYTEGEKSRRATATVAAGA